MTSDDPIDRSRLSGAYNKVNFPGRYETQGDENRVQWAARRAVAALDRLYLECEIVTARNTAAQETRNAKRNRALITSLTKLRGAKP